MTAALTGRTFVPEFLRALGWIVWLLMGGVLLAAAPAPERAVVVYTSQDQVYAEPILRQFQRQTGVKVAAVYDSEAVKTVGLANRLLAEREHPQCDVFWSNEELRTRQLAARHLFRTTNGWTPVGYRTRRIVINTNRLSRAEAPRRLDDLTNAVWRGKVALAYPLFGTTATHFLALRQAWGAQRWEEWCRALAANKPFLVDGNSVAAKFVARGDAWIGLTDSDDIAAERKEGAPVEALPINDETLAIPNTVGVLAGAPHPVAAQLLWEYLRQPSVGRGLVEAQALEGADLAVLPRETLHPNWEQLLLDLAPATETLRRVFLR